MQLPPRSLLSLKQGLDQLDRSELVALQHLFEEHSVLSKWLAHVEATILKDRMTTPVDLSHMTAEKSLFAEGYYLGKIETIMGLAESAGLMGKPRTWVDRGEES